MKRDKQLNPAPAELPAYRGVTGQAEGIGKMEITFQKTVTAKVTHIEVEARVRYWDDAEVNGTADDDGELIPFRRGDAWCPFIRLEDGYVEDWPVGTEASIHYKVCDAGLYWLTDAEGNRVMKLDGYVPGDFLCHGDKGYGDYIIMTIGADGFIADYEAPDGDLGEEWEPVT